MSTPPLDSLVARGLAERAPTGHAPGFPFGPPEVRFRWDGLCELLAPTAYITCDGELVRVPNGRTTDLESRPGALFGFLNWILGPQRETAPAAIIHDELCLRNPDGYPRRRSDGVYWEALEWLRKHNPKITPKPGSGWKEQTKRWAERTRKRAGAAVAYVGLRAYCWLAWKA